MNVTATICSDLHGLYKGFTPPKSDIFISLGDSDINQSKKKAHKFAKWIDKLPHKHKIIVLGNHDKYLNKASNLEMWDMFNSPRVHLLRDQSVVINNIEFIGLSYKNDNYSKIVTKTPDVLLTHKPPLGVLDTNKQGENMGCPKIKKVVKNMEVKYHFFGHCHNSYGSTAKDNILFVNAAQEWRGKLRPAQVLSLSI